MSSYIGIDTSNYTTSISIYNDVSNTIKNFKKSLIVKSGKCGLRQNNAVFQHVQNIPDIINKAFDKTLEISSVGVSSKPRNKLDSYMPCFTVGISIAKCISSIKNIPYYEFSHQEGHIVSALFSAQRLDLLKSTFIAFHVSGGTTEAVLVEPNHEKTMCTKIISQTLDLKAGQLIDRVGIKLGLNFPCGPHIEALASRSNKRYKIKTSIKSLDFCLSGAENICNKMIVNGEKKEDVASFCVQFINETLFYLCSKIINKFGNIPILFSGGVMSNSIIRKSITLKFNGIFATPEFSSDNAAGIAILASEGKNA